MLHDFSKTPPILLHVFSKTPPVLLQTITFAKVKDPIMEDFNRLIENNLLKWKHSKNHKPVILRGARQVGKTTLVKKFSKHFDHFISLNLEQKKDARFFRDTDEVTLIFDALLIREGITLKPERSILLFIDEIQELPQAINLLRYFYEELPGVHVIAAGSLLEFALGKAKRFPVGRIQFHYLYPFNFEEFLEAYGNKQLINAFKEIPVSKSAELNLLDTFHKYAITGGMPEVVRSYIREGNTSALSQVYNSIWQTYKSDIQKYAANKTEEKVIKHILQTAPDYLDERIKFQNFGKSNYRSREVSQAFQSISSAGLIKLIYPTTSLKPPIQTDYKKSPRLQFLDIGIVNNIRGIQASLMLMSDLSQSYKGALIPQLIMQELISINTEVETQPHFWVRDKSYSSAEVDIVYQFKNLLIPIEIKSGTTGTLKSLHQFINLADHSFAVRIYGGTFSIENHQTPEGKPYKLMNLPYYLGTRLQEYLEFFIHNHN